MGKGTLGKYIKNDQNDNSLQEELHNIEKCFTKINGYAKWLLKKIFDSFKTNNKNYNNNFNNKNNRILI